jgi:hypothetical protein
MRPSRAAVCRFHAVITISAEVGRAPEILGLALRRCENV